MNFKNVTAGLCAAVMALTMLPAMSAEAHAAEIPTEKVYTSHTDSNKSLHATGSPIDRTLFQSNCKALTGEITFSKEAYPGVGGVALNNDSTVYAIISGENATIYSKEGGGVFAPSDSARVFNCFGAKTLDLSNLDTSKVTTMYGMFENSKATNINVSNFDTSQVTNMYRMFAEAKSVKLDLSSFDTKKVTTMEGMFWRSKISILDLSSFDTSNVTNMKNMFFGSAGTSVICASVSDMERMQMSKGCAAAEFKVAPPKPVPEPVPDVEKGVNSSGGNGNIPVTLKTAAHTFSVTVPTSLPISVAADGTISCADASACKIINNEEGPVDIKSVTLSGSNSWVIVPTSIAMESEAVNAKKLAMTVMGYETNDGGLNTASFVEQTINGNSDFGIVYTAKLPTQTVETDKAPVANVVFTIGWHEAA